MEYLYDCITELNKPIQERKTEKIIKYIESLTPFMTLIQEDINKNSEHLENTVKILHYVKKLKNEIIVKEGDKGNEFFIILKGKVAILVFQPEYYNMTEEEYILHLLKLKKNNENECIRQTIIHNQLIYPIEDNFDSLFKGLIQRKTTGGVYLENENILKRADEVYCYLKMKNYKDIKKISPNDYIKINRIDNSIIEKSGLNYDEKGNKRNRVLIMGYQLVNYFETGQTFGEVALENSSNKRIATIIATEDCDIVYIVKKEYDLLIKDSIERTIRNFYNVIYSFRLFKFITRFSFDKLYYNYFVYRKFNKGNFLIRQDEECNDLYFIFKGEFEVFTERNIIEVNNLLIIYKKKLIEINPQFEKEYKIINEEKENEDLIMNKKFKNNQSNKILFEKRKINLGIFCKREIIGFSDCSFIYEKEYLKSGIIDQKRKGCVTCKCLSIYGETYNVSQKFFDKMIKDEHSIMRLKGEMEIKKLKLFIEILEHHKKRLFDEIEYKNNQISKEYHILSIKEKNLNQKNRLYNFENNAKVLKDNLKNKINEKDLKRKHSMTNILKKTATIFNKSNQSIKIKNKNLNLMSIKLPKLTIESNEINEKTSNISHKYKRKINRNDQFRNDLFNRNLYDGIFHSYVTTYQNNNNIFNSNSNSKIKNVKSTLNILNLKKMNNKRTITLGSNEEKKNQNYFSPNKKRLIRTKKEVGVYDMLILDRFNSCFNLALKSFSNEK